MAGECAHHQWREVRPGPLAGSMIYICAVCQCRRVMYPHELQLTEAQRRPMVTTEDRA